MRADLLWKVLFPPVTNLGAEKELADHIWKPHLLTLDSMAVGVKETLANDCN